MTAPFQYLDKFKTYLFKLKNKIQSKEHQNWYEKLCLTSNNFYIQNKQLTNFFVKIYQDIATNIDKFWCQVKHSIVAPIVEKKYIS